MKHLVLYDEFGDPIFLRRKIVGKVYFNKSGFKGLTTKSKLIDTLIFLLTFLIGLAIFKASRNIIGYVEALGVALVVAWISQAFLKKDRYFYTEYYCANCGQYMGHSPKRCERCGSNRYTTEDSGVGDTIRNR